MSIVLSCLPRTFKDPNVNKALHDRNIHEIQASVYNPVVQMCFSGVDCQAFLDGTNTNVFKRMGG